MMLRWGLVALLLPAAGGRTFRGISMAGKGNVDPGYIPKTAKVVFNNDVTGSITFTQANWKDPVEAAINVTKLGAGILPAPYFVRRLPVVSGCGPSSTGEHFNAYNVSSTYKSCAGEECEAGDLSAKHGPLNGTKVQIKWVDPTLTLYGFNSIVGRSVVIHAFNGSRVSCGTIKLVDTPMVAAQAVFEVGVKGIVTMVQPAKNPNADTLVLMNLTMAEDLQPPTTLSTQTAKAKATDTGLDVNPVPSDGVLYEIHHGTGKNGMCDGVGDHFNPTKSPPCTWINTSPFIPCDLGDLSGRHGTFSLPASGNQSMYFTDYVPLSGVNSIIGQSLMIHIGDASYCATIKQIDSTFPLQ